MLPTYAIPPEDVRLDLLRPSTGPRASPTPRPTTWWATGGAGSRRSASRRRRPRSMRWPGTGPSPGTPGLAWYEEALEVHVHARDTRKRVDCRPERPSRPSSSSTAWSWPRAGGRSRCSRRTLPTRWYLPLRGRAHGAARRLRHHDSLPVQGHGRVLVGPDRRHPPPGPRLELRRARDRVPADRRARRASSVSGWTCGSTASWSPARTRRGRSRRTDQPRPRVTQWAGVDSNHRRLSRRVYSPFPLATRAPTLGTGRR